MLNENEIFVETAARVNEHNAFVVHSPRFFSCRLESEKPRLWYGRGCNLPQFPQWNVRDAGMSVMRLYEHQIGIVRTPQNHEVVVVLPLARMGEADQLLASTLKALYRQQIFVAEAKINAINKIHP